MGSSCCGNAAASKRQQHGQERDLWLPGDCGAWRVARSRAQPWDREPAKSLCPPSPASPFPSPHLHILLCQSHPVEREELSGMHCMLKMPLLCSQGCQPPPEAQVPLAWRMALEQWKRRQVQSLEHTVPCYGTPLSHSPRGALCSYPCKPSLSSTASSLGKLSSGSSGVSASAGRQQCHGRDHT